MLTKATTDAIKEIAPPVIVNASSHYLGTLQSWALILTIVYAAVRLLFLIPKVIGCGRCFIRNKTCVMTCKTTPGE